MSQPEAAVGPDLDRGALPRQWLEAIEDCVEQLIGLAGMTLTIDPLYEAGKPVLRLYVAVDPEVAGVVAGPVVQALRNDEPSIAVLPQIGNGKATGFVIGSDLLQPAEHETVGRPSAATFRLDGPGSASRRRKSLTHKEGHIT